MNISLAPKCSVIQTRKNAVVRRHFGLGGPQHVCEVGVGDTSLCHVSKWVGNTRVTLVDANPICCRACRKLLSPAVVHWVAIVGWEHKEPDVTLRIARPSSLFGSGYVDGVDSPHLQQGGTKLKHFIVVPAATFDKIDDGTIDYLTVDIEGSEIHVVSQMVSRPKIVFVEMNSNVYTNPHTEEIKRIMEERGYIRLTGLQIGSDWGWRLEQ